MKCTICASTRGSILGLAAEAYVFVRDQETGETLAGQLMELHRTTKADLERWAWDEIPEPHRVEKMEVEPTLLAYLDSRRELVHA